MMKLSEFKTILNELDTISFELPTGELVPSHFHVTEIGKITKNFIDCGGTVREEKVVSLQLWQADDYDHRLHPEKLLKIIQLSEKVFENMDLEIEVEYQGTTINKFGLEYKDNRFFLTTKQTDCLAKDNCGIPENKTKVKLSELHTNNTCAPNSGCC